MTTMSKGASTRNEAVFNDLRRDILGGRLLPGQRLPFAELCARYVASVGVVREALTRLVEQGLVQSEPQQGFRVVPLSKDDLSDLTQARLDIETLVLRYAIQSADVGWESRVLAAHHRLSRTPQAEPDNPDSLSEQWAEAHAAYHSTLLDGGPNRRLKSVAGSLRDSAELYRRWSRSIAHDSSRDIAAEHLALLEAVLARDEELAIDLLSQHIQHTTQAVLTAAADDGHASEGAAPLAPMAVTAADELPGSSSGGKRGSR
jgi:DNA-binding GntR family transcriptional regulator